MINSEVFTHIIVTVVYFLAITVLRGNFDISVLWLWVGAFVGAFILDIDHLIYWFWTNPQKEDSQQAFSIWKTKGLKSGKDLFSLLKNSHFSHQHLIFHTVVFQVVLLITTFFVLTSSNNIFVAGLVLSMNLHLLKDEWQDFIKNPVILSGWLFWQVRIENPRSFLDFYLTLITIIFLFLTVLVI